MATPMAYPSKWFGFFRNPADPTTAAPLVSDWIDPDWLPSDRLRLIAYLSNCPSVVAEPTPIRCGLCGAPLAAMAYHSDGTWLWPDDLIHGMRAHNIRLPDEFAAHIRAKGYVVPAKVDALPRLP